MAGRSERLGARSVGIQLPCQMACRIHVAMGARGNDQAFPVNCLA